MIRDYPDIRQKDAYDCGAAVVDGVFRHFGVRASAVLCLSDAVDGTHPTTIEGALRRAGLTVQSGQMTVADLRHHTRSGRVVLTPVSTFGGHWVTVLGVPRSRVHYHCPTNGPQSANYVVWTLGWRDSTRLGHAFDQWGIAVGLS